MKVLAFSGSSSSTSINARLLEHATSRLRPDVAVETVSVRDVDAPMFSVDDEAATGIPTDVASLHARFLAADAVIIASPEHNGYMPAMMKNVVDWLSRVKTGGKWAGRRVLLLSTSPGPGGGQYNLNHLASVIPYWGADLVGKLSVPRFYDVFDQETGTLTDPALVDELDALLSRLVAPAATVSAPSAG